MAKYRIKAYFMHEHEQAAAQEAVNASDIADAEWTSGYVMGVVDESSIDALSKKGLVVSLVEQVSEKRLHRKRSEGRGDPVIPLATAKRQ